MISAFEHFRPHHEELRKRLLRSICACFAATALAYIWKDHLAALCMQPLFRAAPDLQRLVYTKLTEAFLSYIKLSLLAGIFISFPYVLYQAWMFIAPGLTPTEKRSARRTIFWGAMLFAGGALFGFFIALPQLLAFFMHYAGPNLIPMPKFGLYLTFIGRMVLAFAIAFEIPFLMIAAQKAGLVSTHYFARKRLWYYCAIAGLSFLLSAGEVTAAVLLSMPLFFLYESGSIIGNILFSSR
ncbi:MAG: twin-arginine translocase subunit TatC [Desulfobulbus propionicus]|nr:MAG: twin-arginine translocase subunit TatC [Desulfobulbus propionicus]